MALTTHQLALIEAIDYHVMALLANHCDDKELFGAMLEWMPAVKTLMQTVPQPELEQSARLYDGFYYYMKSLEMLANDIAAGSVEVPT